MQNDVNAILGPAGRTAVAPAIEDARSRIGAAIASVAATDKTPRQILTFSQKRALFSAMQSGERAQLGLTDGQRTDLETYVRDVASAALPIVREDGDRVEASLAPDQRIKLDAMAAAALARLRERASALPIPNPVDALARGAGDRAGALVLFAEIDPRELMSTRR